MDFEDTPEEAAYRAQVRAWLDANALHFQQRARIGVTESKQWQKKKDARRRLCRYHLGQGIWRPGRHIDAKCHLWPGRSQI